MHRAFQCQLIATIALLTHAVAALPLRAQNGGTSARAGDASANSQISQLENEVTQMAQQLGDWSEQYPILADAIENMFQQNNWNSESHLWAKHTALEIEKIPPWQMSQRLQALSQAVSRRYRMEPDQVRQFHRILRNGVLELGVKYAPLGLSQAKELIQTRLDGRPFTPEQVARLEQAWDPYIDDMLKDIDELTNEFGSILTTRTQQQLWRRDLQSMQQRTRDILKIREEWKKGNWNPQDWGLQNDPIHAQAAAQAEPPAVISPIRSSAQSIDESTWAAYVRAFIQQYQLDEGQQATCTAILDDVVDRATRYRQSYAAALDAVPRNARSTHRMFTPIRQLFEELKQRLADVPTEAQYHEAARRYTAPDRSQPPPRSSRAHGRGT